MELSRFLSKVIGLYLLIVSIALLANTDQFYSLAAGMVQDGPLMFVTGFFTLILGIMMVVSHSVWELNWRVLITLVAWLTLFKGITLIYCPPYLVGVTHQMMGNPALAVASGSIDLLLGLMFIYFGFRKAS